MRQRQVGTCDWDTIAGPRVVELAVVLQFQIPAIGKSGNGINLQPTAKAPDLRVGWFAWLMLRLRKVAWGDTG